MGLLGRAKSLYTADDTFSASMKRAESLIGFVNAIPECVDYPSEVFHAVRALLKFDLGTMMLPDESLGCYVPWISSDFDRAAIRKFRIPRDFPPLRDGGRRVLNGIAPEHVAPFFPKEKCPLMENPLFVRFGPAHAPTALIFVPRGPKPRELESLSAALERLANELSSGIARGRALVEFPVAAEQGLPEWLDGWEGTEADLIVLDISETVDTVMDSIPGLDLYRITCDVIGLVCRITGRMGRAYNLKDGRLIILFPAQRLPDLELYLNQLALTFASAFHHLRSTPAFPVQSFQWPSQRDAVEECLAGLI